MARPRLVGINHIALEVGDIDEALAFYGRLFELTLRGRSREMAFIDIGDQFIALSRGRSQPADEHRHFGLVVDEHRRDATRARGGGRRDSPGRGLNFRDPWGNLVQVVQYDEVQFMKTAAVLHSMGLELGKSDRALAELRAKGIEPGGSTQASRAARLRAGSAGDAASDRCACATRPRGQVTMSSPLPQATASVSRSPSALDHPCARADLVHGAPLSERSSASRYTTARSPLAVRLPW